MNEIKRVDLTEEAKQLIKQLKQQYGKLMFYQSGGCCDGSAPMCYRLGDFKIGSSDVLLGWIEECPFYISKQQYDYWKHTQLMIDVTQGRGASFSLEIPLGVRFITRSRVFTEQELQHLQTEN